MTSSRRFPQCLLASALLLLVLLVSACQAQEVRPFNGAITSNETVVVVGRLFPWPNPIFIPDRPGPEGLACTQLALMNLGTETLTIEGLVWEGGPAICPYSWPDGGHQWPMETSGGGPVLEVCYAPGAGPPTGGLITVRTNDPISPTLEIPVIVISNPGAFLEEIGDEIDSCCFESNGIFYFGSFEPVVEPNPIRLSPIEPDNSTIVTIRIHTDGDVSVTAVETVGGDLRIVSLDAWTPGGWDGTLPLDFFEPLYDTGIEVRLEYTGLSDKAQGLGLRVEMVNYAWQRKYHLIVPVVIE